MMRLRHCQLCRSLQLSVLFDLVWVCLVFLSPLGSFCFCVCEVAADSRVVAALQLCYVAMSIKLDVLCCEPCVPLRTTLY